VAAAAGNADAAVNKAVAPRTSRLRRLRIVPSNIVEGKE
jgi:hypothetical protein